MSVTHVYTVEMGCQMVQLLSAHTVGPTMCVNLTLALSYPSRAIMSVFAMESQYMKTIMIHLADKSDFILSDHKTRCKSLQ